MIEIRIGLIIRKDRTIKRPRIIAVMIFLKYASSILSYD